MKPLGSRIIALQQEASTKTASGLLLTAPTQQPPIAIVQEVGPDVTTLKKKQKILYNPQTIITVVHNGKSIIIIEERDVLAILTV